MDKVSDLCRSITQSVKETFACAIIDLEVEKFLGNYSLSEKTISEDITIACANLLKSQSLARFEELVLSHRGINKNQNKQFQEILISSHDSYLLAKILKNGKLAVILMVSKKASNDTTWAQLKLFVPAIEAIVS